MIVHQGLQLMPYCIRLAAKTCKQQQQNTVGFGQQFVASLFGSPCSHCSVRSVYFEKHAVLQVVTTTTGKHAVRITGWLMIHALSCVDKSSDSFNTQQQYDN